jgi:BirA family biotin operon repressor/biotin-[acetyl-CoA-carboxylase] ligase
VLAAYDALPADIGPRYRDALATLGRAVRVELGDGIVEATATDVDPDGRLVVVDRCGLTHRIDAGDVVHLR